MKAIYLRKAFPTILYYFAGYVLTWIVSELERPHYAHGPNFFHLIALLFLVGGLLWAVTNFLQVYAGKKEYMLSLAVNLLVVTSILIYVFFLV
ncbi:hypothetical protein [Paracnuella aquatica]|uniref:hypothetical protein n=1 Tax=Paracnuella aquatica TaxID=2268757 RepID=UPI000DEF12B8|nr:hypothetical protein [Paracnuella aquatica]RPD50864.1 hypothetical protein DRJ53_05050 [Paracnuella aquatica]